jgi:GST-like protein
MLALYTAPTPNGRKVSIALEELGVPYDVHVVDLARGEQHRADFLRLCPNHKIPVIDDDGFVLWESGAILLFLAEKHGGLLPAAPAERWRAIQLAFFQSGGLGPAAEGLLGQLRLAVEARSRDLVAHFGDETSRLFEILERLLFDDRPYLAGASYSVADVMHYPWLQPFLAMEAPPLLEQARVVAWLRRIGDRPAVQRGMAVP